MGYSFRLESLVPVPFIFFLAFRSPHFCILNKYIYNNINMLGKMPWKRMNPEMSYIRHFSTARQKQSVPRTGGLMTFASFGYIFGYSFLLAESKLTETQALCAISCAIFKQKNPLAGHSSSVFRPGDLGLGYKVIPFSSASFLIKACSSSVMLAITCARTLSGLISMIELSRDSRDFKSSAASLTAAS